MATTTPMPARRPSSSPIYAKGLGTTEANARRQTAKPPEEATAVRPLTNAPTIRSAAAAELRSALTDEGHNQTPRLSAGSTSLTNEVTKAWLDSKAKLESMLGAASLRPTWMTVTGPCVLYDKQPVAR